MARSRPRPRPRPSPDKFWINNSRIKTTNVEGGKARLPQPLVARWKNLMPPPGFELQVPSSCESRLWRTTDSAADMYSTHIVALWNLRDELASRSWLYRGRETLSLWSTYEEVEHLPGSQLPHEKIPDFGASGASGALTTSEKIRQSALLLSRPRMRTEPNEPHVMTTHRRHQRHDRR
jgi:hypothetical protein